MCVKRIFLSCDVFPGSSTSSSSNSVKTVNGPTLVLGDSREAAPVINAITGVTAIVMALALMGASFPGVGQSVSRRVSSKKC